eukprot:TRINITY_DN138_c1_g2_i1.p1 TRINITY_DN138_c1_g2~~TRINITY_DN138_c1_g2_i1.p1  ORF type:complete len:629 (+),score=232.77 TRINITY_DN138_c1_g2_i1:134-2020(+)
MVRKKGEAQRSLREINYNDPSVTFWFFPQNSKNVIENHTVIKETTILVQKKPLKQPKPKITVETTQETTVKNGELSHPLINFVQDLPPLTDLQVFITEAILSEDGASTTFERIFDYVSKRWRYIRRRDGSNYTTDCRRAIQANLRHNPNHVALFRKDKKVSGNWTVCRTMEDAIEASKMRQAEKRGNKKDRDDGDEKDDSMSEDEEMIPNAEMPIEEKATTPELTEEKKVKIGSPKLEPKEESEKEEELKEEELEEEGEEVNDPDVIPEEAEESIEEGDEDEEEIRDEHENPILKDARLTPLQATICESIVDNGGTCHFDLIVHHVSKSWNKIKTGNTDVKTAILSALTDSKKIFKRDTKRTGWWIINKDLEGITHAEDNFSRSSRSKSRDAMKKMTSPQTKRKNENSDEEEKKEADRKEKDPPMTELQILIIEAIDNCGGSATFEQIFDHVNKKFDNLKRRDGTPYTSECRRAIQASLSNNPTTRPFFKKETKKGNAVWSLAKRSIEFLADYRRKKEAGIDPLEEEEEEEEEQKTVKKKDKRIQDDSSDQDDDDEDEKDESSESSENEDEEDEEEEEEDDNKKRKFDGKESVSRLKRQKQLKEKSQGKRQLRDMSPNKDLRSRKKRR